MFEYKKEYEEKKQSGVKKNVVLSVVAVATLLATSVGVISIATRQFSPRPTRIVAETEVTTEADETNKLYAVISKGTVSAEALLKHALSTGDYVTHMNITESIKGSVTYADGSTKYNFDKGVTNVTVVVTYGSEVTEYDINVTAFSGGVSIEDVDIEPSVNTDSGLLPTVATGSVVTDASEAEGTETTKGTEVVEIIINPETSTETEPTEAVEEPKRTEATKKPAETTKKPEETKKPASVQTQKPVETTRKETEPTTPKPVETEPTTVATTPKPVETEPVVTEPPVVEETGGLPAGDYGYVGIRYAIDYNNQVVYHNTGARWDVCVELDGWANFYYALSMETHVDDNIAYKALSYACACSNFSGYDIVYVPDHWTAEDVYNNYGWEITSRVKHGTYVDRTGTGTYEYAC